MCVYITMWRTSYNGATTDKSYLKSITKSKHLILRKKLKRDWNHKNKSTASKKNVGFTSTFLWKPNLLPTNTFTQDNEIKREGWKEEKKEKKRKRKGKGKEKKRKEKKREEKKRKERKKKRKEKEKKRKKLTHLIFKDWLTTRLHTANHFHTVNSQSQTFYRQQHTYRVLTKTIIRSCVKMN